MEPGKIESPAGARREGRNKENVSKCIYDPGSWKKHRLRMEKRRTLALILNIDTATETGSVCLARDGVVLESRTSGEQKDHAAVITPFIRELTEECGVAMEELEAVAVSAGPGSYTGLRVGVSTAKGLCYALDLPLIAIGTLRIMASGMKTLCSVEKGQAAADLLYAPLLDARRADVYGALYTAAGDPLLEPSALTVDQDFLATWRSKQLLLFGTGAAKAQKLASGPPGWQFRPFTCHASWLAPLAEEAFQGGRFSDPAYFEPLYVKPFYSPAPKTSS